MATVIGFDGPKLGVHLPLAQRTAEIRSLLIEALQHPVDHCVLPRSQNPMSTGCAVPSASLATARLAIAHSAANLPPLTQQLPDRPPSPLSSGARMPPPLRERFQAVAEELGEELIQTAQSFMKGAPGVVTRPVKKVCSNR